MSISAGKLRHVIRVEQRLPSPAAGGGNVYAWTLFKVWRASIEPMRGTEEVEARQRVGRVPTRFRMRYLAGLAQTMRIVWGGRPYDIKSVEMVDGIRHEMVVVADRMEVPA